ncbi:MBL fold metallo-hydrolase [Paenibacillus jiagnxiensis]|uniref:MBL fold metallo-hydrolase n=1 Tax=Paenibacillus jiagnxiensis TaxID=3228926 RepID=UPI0033ADD22C
MMTSLSVKLLLGAAGYCTHPEFLTLRGGTLRPVSFPAGFACMLHPKYGPVLFDTGYSGRFFTETARLPNALYRHITPVMFREEDSAASQLRKVGITPQDVQYIVLSHFHADHIGGLRDFPNARFIYLQKAYNAVKQLGSLRRVRAGFLPGLLPDDFAARSLPVAAASVIRPFEPGFPFHKAYDLFGDGSMLAVELSGHATGMIGLLVSTERQDYLLCADAVWSSRAFMEKRPPHPAAGLIMSDRGEYKRSFELLRQLHTHYPAVRIVPSHCREALAAWGTRGWE